MRPFGLTFLKNNWWGVWPSCQMMKNCCGLIWAPKSGKSFRPRKQFFSNLVFGPWIFVCKKSYQMFTKNYWWVVWPSFQMTKKCCWLIWAQRSGKNFRPKKQFSKIWVLDCKKKFCKKNYKYPNSNSPLFGLIGEKRIRSFSQQYCRLQKPSKVICLNLPFFGPYSPPHNRYGPKILPNPKIVNRTFVH